MESLALLNYLKIQLFLSELVLIERPKLVQSSEGAIAFMVQGT